MSSPDYVQLEPIILGQCAGCDEKWVQGLISANPSILGLGESLTVKDIERRQPKAGRLDILLQDREAERRYEVEVQLGATDPSHIIRTIGYWDIERKRYPQYKHTAVIVAEDITARFLNVISLFNGFMPLVAIQMKAVKCGDQIGLVFTKVLDQMTLGCDDEEDDGHPTGVTRQKWETWAPPEIVALADQLLELIHTFAPSTKLNYTNSYVGLAQDGLPNNFVLFVPQKKVISMEVFNVGKSEDLENQFAEKRIAFTLTSYGYYKIKLLPSDVKEHAQFLTDLMKKAFDEKMK